MKLTPAVFVMILLFSGSMPAQESDPIGNEFQVNTYTTDNQLLPSVAMGPEGDFVVVWRSDGSYGTDNHFSSIQGQRYDATGAPLGGEFQVNTFTEYWQYRTDISMGADGDFVVVWDANFGGPDWYQIQAQLYDAGGNPAGGEFAVHAPGGGSYPQSPSAGMDSLGNFVVVWQEDNDSGYGGDDYWIAGQIFDASGTPVGTQLQISSSTTQGLVNPSVAMGSGGEFVVVWTVGAYPDYGPTLFARRYDASGSPAGGEFQVNTYVTDLGCCPDVAHDSNRGFFVVWSGIGSNGTDSDSMSVQGRLFDVGGNPKGSQFQLNSHTTGSQESAAVAIAAGGDIVVTWSSSASNGNDLDGYSYQGQLFRFSGEKSGTQFQINTYTSGNQWLGATAIKANGEFVVVWSSVGSYGTDSDGRSVQGQRFASHSLAFADGFESGDTSGWSNSVQ